ncbi:group II truncated hemoglobin [Halobacteriovorax sp. GB3]|nr:group II truncated hemoglobin [Halobacteriovorax sp. GB3]
MNVLNKIKKLLKRPEKVSADQVTPYLLIGEEKGLNKLVERFYFYMDTLDEAKRCRDLHGQSLEGAKMKLKMFLSGWFGGPQLFMEKYGHPRMRMRHMPFKITTIERDEWLLCMRKAMDDLKLNEEFDGYLWESFKRFAEHMRNH